MQEGQEPEKMQIQMLGGFQITIGEITIKDTDNHSQQMWNLLEYLIVFRNQAISPRSLADSLWPGDKSNNPSNALKNLIYRIRTMFAGYGVPFARELIRYHQNTYSWNNSFACEIDIEQFANLCAQAADAGQPDETRIALYLRAFELYRGNFLPNSGYREWAVALVNDYRRLYFSSVYDACALLAANNRFDTIEAVCGKAIEFDPFEECAHQYFIEALVRQGKQSQALAHYNELTELFYRELGVSLSESVRSLYREIVKTVNSVQTDLSVIKEDLCEQQAAQGAFYCAYEIFKCMYRVEARTATRTGQSIFIALLTVTDQNNQVPELPLLGKVMDQLLESVRLSLRKGDVISRFSATQYVLMLPTLTYENGRIVLSRIEKRFKQDFRGKEIKLHTALQPLDPLK
jgi:DNA-binding SARP family transcriptional activator